MWHSSYPCVMRLVFARRVVGRTFFVCLLWLISGLGQSTIAVEDGSGVPAVEPPSRKELATVQTQCAREIERIKSAIDELDKETATPPPKHLIVELELWERLELITAQRESSLVDLAETHRQREIFESRRVEFERTGVEQEQSYSFTRLDSVRDELLTAQREKELLDLELESEMAFLEETDRQLDHAQQARRLADATIISDDKEKTAAKLHERTLSLVRCRVLKSEIDLHRERCHILTEGIDLADANVAEMQTRVDLFASNVVFSQEDLDQRIAHIGMFEEDIRNQLVQANRRLHYELRNRALNQVRAASGASVEGEESQTRFETARDETQLLQELLTEIGGVRECWRNRFDLANENFEPEEPDRWLVEARSSMQRLEHLVEKLNLRMRHQQNALSKLVRKKMAGDLDAQMQIQLESQIADIEHLVEFYASTQVLAAGGERLYERFVAELESRIDEMSWLEFSREVGRWVSAAWKYEITTIDDQPITISTIVCGFILLLGGYWVSRMIASVVARVVLPKFGLGQTAIAPVRTVIHYLLAIAFTFLALDVVNVPLTVFAFMGGAIAIGAGFGSQNLINNFISGLILIVERPIRIGDLVNVDGIEANIEKIGARSTTVRTGSNLDILVPNSKFLENNVTNWTLSNTQIRTSVTVGVAYGSPVKSVIQILESVVRNHPKVLGSQDPIVLFKDFGDNSLDFEVHFWIHMRRMMDSNRVESDVRVEIDNAFREHDISIAFPQRDVHLDLKAPLEVNLSDSGRLAARANLELGRRAA